jgi:hypothetical protein
MFLTRARLLYFRRMPAKRQSCFAEAVTLLIASRIALRVLPFRWIAAFLDHPFGPPRVTGPAAAAIRSQVQWAVDRACVLPGDSSCFRRAMTAHAMCRARGVHTTLYYGAAVDAATGVQGHTWLQDGSTEFIGCQSRKQYSVLATFPANSCD